MSSGRKFTATEDEALRTLHRAKMKVIEIARALGRSDASVRWRMGRLGLARYQCSNPIAKEAPVVKQRKCLKCRMPFQAEKHNFLCQPCKSSSEWRSGGSFEVRI